MFFDPHFAFRGVFELPDRRDLLQFVDRPLAGAKGLCAMLCPNDDQHDIFTDADFSIPMEHESLDDIEIFERPFANLLELLPSHSLILLERNAIDIPPLRSVAGRSEKNRNSADSFRSVTNPVDFLIDRKVFTLHTRQLRVASRPHGISPCEGRQKRHFVIVTNVDILVSDLGLPGQDGYALIRQLRAMERASGRTQMPAIALTGHGSPSHSKKSRSLSQRGAWVYAYS